MTTLEHNPLQFPAFVDRARAGDREALGELLVYAGPTLRIQAKRRLEQKLQGKFTQGQRIKICPNYWKALDFVNTLNLRFSVN